MGKKDAKGAYRQPAGKGVHRTPSSSSSAKISRNLQRVMDGRSFSNGLRQRAAILAQKKQQQQTMTESHECPLTAFQLDPVLQALDDIKGMFATSAVDPVRKFGVPPNGAKFVIYFDDEDLREYGNVMVEIHKKGWPLGHPLSADAQACPKGAELYKLLHPQQQKLGRQRRALLRMFREETTGTGSLLETSASKVARYSIWEQGHAGVRYFEWVNGFE